MTSYLAGFYFETFMVIEVDEQWRNYWGYEIDLDTKIYNWKDGTKAWEGKTRWTRSAAGLSSYQAA